MATVATSLASATSSRAMRVFPIPAGPTIVQSVHVCWSRDRAKASRIWSCSRSRPTRDVVGCAATCSIEPAEQPPRLHRRRPAPDFERLQRFRLHVGLDQAIGAVAEQDLPWRRPLLQARGDVDGVPGCKGLPPRSATDEDVAGVHADADGELDPVDCTNSSLSSATASRSSTAARTAAQRVVFVELSQAEERNHRVAYELLDLAAVATEDRPRDARKPLQDSVHRLRIKELPEGGGVNDVRKNDG